MKRSSSDKLVSGSPDAKKKKVKFTAVDKKPQHESKDRGKNAKTLNKTNSVSIAYPKKNNLKDKSKLSKDVKGNSFKNKKDAKNVQEVSEKPNWSVMKKEKKLLRIHRRKAKSTAEVFEISHKAKLLSAQIQRKVVKTEFRLNACKELHLLIKGQYKSIALTHDLSRVIQVLLKYSPEDIKTEITQELLDVIVQMVQSKYGQHAVKRILKYGTDFIRHEVIKRFLGHIVTLAAHTISCPVLDYAYGEFATKQEKLHMQQEFYGEIYKNSKDNNVKTLSDAYKDSPELKTAILQSCKANIQRILDKNLHDNELFQTVVYDYIRECSAEDRAELITTLSPLIVPLSNSLPGVNAACICVWQGSNKDKKTILKVVKEHTVPLSKHKTGYRLLLAIFDSVDDTVLVKKAIVTVIANNLESIVKDHWGNMTLHWLVKPKDTAAFHPSLIGFLEQGHKTGTSKKDSGIRVTELREAIMPALKKHIEENPQFWLSGKTIMLLAIAVLSIETSKKMLQSLAEAICDSRWEIENNGKKILAIEDAGIHMCLKKLACLDKDKSEDTFAEAISEHLSEETVKVWLSSNRGCFFLLKLIQSNAGDVSKKLKSKVKAHLSLLKQTISQGAILLLQNM